MGNYNVAFRYTKKTGGYHGVITWSSFSSKKYFGKWYTPEIREREEVVEKGITEERAIELTQSTPLKCRIAAARQAATNPDGTINNDILEMEMKNVAFGEEEISSKIGIKNRGNSGEGIWENGWILPDGKFINCKPIEHIRCAEEILGTTEKELEKTAIKVSCKPSATRLKEFGTNEYCPNFLTERRRMTHAQLATIEKYCVKHGLRPPEEYFIQQELYEMAKMRTEDILTILAK